MDDREITALEKLEERDPKAALLKTLNSKELRKRLAYLPLISQQLNRFAWLHLCHSAN